jgi:hypothetical protein
MCCAGGRTRSVVWAEMVAEMGPNGALHDARWLANRFPSEPIYIVPYAIVQLHPIDSILSQVTPRSTYETTGS